RVRRAVSRRRSPGNVRHIGRRCFAGNVHTTAASRGCVVYAGRLVVAGAAEITDEIKIEPSTIEQHRACHDKTVYAAARTIHDCRHSHGAKQRTAARKTAARRPAGEGAFVRKESRGSCSDSILAAGAVIAQIESLIPLADECDESVAGAARISALDR